MNSVYLKKLSIFALSLLISFSAIAFDHSHKNWNEVLSKYVILKDGQSYFEYKKLKENKKLIKTLENYLSDLSLVSSDKYDGFNETQRFSFLVNAYNAFTIKLIIDNYPVESIKDIGSLFSSPWKKDFFKLFGKKTNLDYIEHGLLRKKFNEPRVHFAVNCASLGCPNLLNQAFTEKNMERLLLKGEKDFFSQKSKNKLELDDNRVYVSKIFSWFGEDFEKKHGSLKKYLALAFNEKKVDSDDIKVKFTDYSWDLNEL